MAQGMTKARTIGDVLLDVEGISISFGGVKALDNVSFDVREHEILAIIGPNGAGKSSMLNCINGFYHPQEGMITFKGNPRHQMQTHEAAEQGIARTFQNIALFKGMSTLDNIMTGRNLKMKKNFLWQALYFGPALKEELEHRAKVEEIIDFLEIEAIRKTPVGKLPYGLQKRVELGRALHAAGVRPGDIIHNTFSYHLTPAGMMFETAAHAIGCTVVPAGTGQTEQQVQAIAHLRPSVYAGTPSFLKVLLDRAAEEGADVGSLTKAVVAAEALPEALRQDFNGHGIQCLQAYASADLGLIAYESKAMDGLIIDERLIVEIVRPGSGEQVPDGDIGEVIVTTLNREYPLIRFATGDLSSVMEGASPCGRTAMRLTGWKGRADQSTKVKGMFVTPTQIAAVLKRHAEIGKARLVVEQRGGKDTMTLLCEVIVGNGGGDDQLATAIADTLQSLCNLKGEVDLTEPGSLANDGLVIEDKRAVD